MRSYLLSIAENTGRSPDVRLVLGQRRRRWPNINPALFQPLVFSGSLAMSGGAQMCQVLDVQLQFIFCLLS